MRISLKGINRCDVYVALYLIYMMQGFLYPVGVLNQMLQFILLIMALFTSAKYIISNNYRMPFFKATVWLLIMYIIYGLAFIFSKNISTSSFIYMQNVLNSLLPIFMFYDYTKRGYVEEKRIRIYFIGFLIAFILRGIYQKQLALETFADSVDTLGGFTDNSGYLYVTLIPFLFFFRGKSIIQYVALLLCVFLVFTSMKRGAIMIALLEAVVLVYCNYKYSSGKKHKLYILLITALSLVYSISFVKEQIDSNEYVALRVEQTKGLDTSKRDELYDKVIKELGSEQSIVKILFGRGAYSTIKVAGDMAHQDWLETACNNGLLGVVILALFFFTLFKSVLRSRKLLGNYLFYSYLCVFAVIFLKTLFSMSIMNIESSLSLLMGYYYYKTKSLRLSQPISDQ